MQVQPYLSFEGRCEEAIEFYKKALGAKVEMLMRFKDAPQGSMPGECGPALKDKVMHAALSEGGQVQQPLTETFFSPAFGMVADRFGVSWMVLVPGQMNK